MVLDSPESARFPYTTLFRSLALAIAGAADMVSGLFRLTIWNRTIPDAMRGRLASIELLSYTSGPSLGNFEAGLGAAPAEPEGTPPDPSPAHIPPAGLCRKTK